jgi:hypothetical protein
MGVNRHRMPDAGRWTSCSNCQSQNSRVRFSRAETEQSRDKCRRVLTSDKAPTRQRRCAAFQESLCSAVSQAARQAHQIHACACSCTTASVLVSTSSSRRRRSSSYIDSRSSRALRACVVDEPPRAFHIKQPLTRAFARARACERTHTWRRAAWISECDKLTSSNSRSDSSFCFIAFCISSRQLFCA